MSIQTSNRQRMCRSSRIWHGTSTPYSSVGLRRRQVLAIKLSRQGQSSTSIRGKPRKGASMSNGRKRRVEGQTKASQEDAVNTPSRTTPVLQRPRRGRRLQEGGHQSGSKAQRKGFRRQGLQVPPLLAQLARHGSQASVSSPYQRSRRAQRRRGGRPMVTEELSMPNG